MHDLSVQKTATRLWWWTALHPRGSGMFSSTNIFTRTVARKLWGWGYSVCGGHDCLLYTFWNFDSKCVIWKYCSHAKDLHQEYLTYYWKFQRGEKSIMLHQHTGISHCVYTVVHGDTMLVEVAGAPGKPHTDFCIPPCFAAVTEWGFAVEKETLLWVFESSAVLFRLAAIVLECTYLLVFNHHYQLQNTPIMEELDRHG